jgi:hypothetical protein
MSTEITAEQFVSALEGMVDQRPVVVLDFDGVLADSLDDDIYALSPLNDGTEIPLLARAAAKFKLKCPDLTAGYKRHLIYQEAAHALGIPIESGPFLRVAEYCDASGLIWYIISARSGQAGVRRLYEFLETKRLFPTEIFNVGEHVTKIEQLKRISDGAPDSMIFFVDDSDRNIKEVADARIANVHVRRPVKGRSKEETYLVGLWKSVVKKAMKNPKLQTAETIKLALSNGLRQFSHYATQRNTSIRFFLLLVALLATGYYRSDMLLAKLAICAIAVAVTLIFWGFDRRNIQLVEAAEGSIKIGEEWIRHSIESTSPHEDAAAAEIIRVTERKKREDGIQIWLFSFRWGYKELVDTLMRTVLGAISVAAFIAIWQILSAPSFSQDEVRNCSRIAATYQLCGIKVPPGTSFQDVQRRAVSRGLRGSDVLLLQRAWQDAALEQIGRTCPGNVEAILNSINECTRLFP